MNWGDLAKMFLAGAGALIALYLIIAGGGTITNLANTGEHLITGETLALQGR